VAGLDERLQSALPEHYVIERELGRGGMATVYLAEDRKHHRQVAVKVLHPDLASILGRTRFLREIEIEASLQHPGIIPLYDSGATDEVTYYVMPYVEGDSLRERLDREKQLPLESALRIAREVGDALAHAHAHHIIHRDIKPGNILLSGGHALVADFGIARAVTVAAGEQITTSGLAVGTPAYMSPEQASAKDPVDQRADIYALGCVVYEMLAGQPPFTGATAQAVLAQHRLERPPSLEVVRPGVGHGVQHVVDKALAKAPADRYQTVEEFLAALEQAAVAPESGEYSPARRGLRRWWWAGAWAVPAVAAATAILLGGFPRALDSNRIVVFPLQARGDSSVRPDGVMIGSLINAALETAEPLVVRDGWTWLTPEQRHDPTLITNDDMARIARRQHARNALGGWVLRAGDSLRVGLSLLDVQADSLLPQVSQAGIASPTAATQLGLRALGVLLSRFLAHGRRLDILALQDRDPAAVVATVLGDLAYRDSKFTEARAHYRRALALDSAMVLAAVKGASSASWNHADAEARALVGVALRHLDRVPVRYRYFVTGLRAYFANDPDAAAAAFGRAIALDSGWTEAWMARGEVHYHFLYDGWNPDSLAEADFERARRLDPGFAPALYHLAELSLRRGWSPRGDSLYRALRAAGPDPKWVRQILWLSLCMRSGPDAVEWARLAHGSVAAAEEMLTVGHRLATGGAQPVCAERALAAVLDGAPRESLFTRWDALVGLQSLLVAQRRYRELRTLLDVAKDSVHRAALGLALVDAVAGAGTDSLAAQAIRDQGGDAPDFRALRTIPTLWFQGLWAWHGRDAQRLARVVDALAARLPQRDSTGVDSLIHGAMAARLSVLRADTARAIALLSALSPRGTMGKMAWDFWAPLAEERLLLARLLLARGEYAAALRVGGVFDAAAPIGYVPYVPASLAVRLRAAERLGRSDLASRFRARLVALGRRDLL